MLPSPASVLANPWQQHPTSNMNTLVSSSSCEATLPHGCLWPREHTNTLPVLVHTHTYTHIAIANKQLHWNLLQASHSEPRITYHGKAKQNSKDDPTKQLSTVVLSLALTTGGSENSNQAYCCFHIKVIVLHQKTTLTSAAQSYCMWCLTAASDLASMLQTIMLACKLLRRCLTSTPHQQQQTT